MSILIKGMEMPKRCEDCFCYRHNAEYDYAYCNISSVNVLGHGNARLNNCPLVPVPPHGRLIDADALIKELTIDDLDDHNGATLLMAVFLEVLKDAPTIILAEEADHA